MNPNARYCASTLLVWGVLVVASVAQASAPQAVPTFDAATIKLNDTHSNARRTQVDPGRLMIENQTLRTLLTFAYGVKAQQIVGPDWIDTEAYDVNATAGAPLTWEEMMPMLTSLLRDRLGLQVHREQRPMRVLALVVAKSGLKLHPADTESERGTSRSGGFLEFAAAIPMDRLADELSSYSQLAIVNRSGLPGNYTIDLKWTPDWMVANGSSPPQYPDLAAALADQAGLNLESRMEPLDVVVVDHVERVPKN